MKFPNNLFAWLSLPIKNSSGHCAVTAAMIALLFLSVSTGFAATGTPENSKRILVLNSYHIGFKWTDDIVRGINERLSNNDLADYELLIEYMDSKRHVGDLYYQRLAGILDTKYFDRPVDVVICSDNNAFNFLKKYGDNLFPGVPVVFCGVNFFTISDVAGHKNFTGVSEETDFLATLELALKLHPGTKNLLVINDTTTTGLRLRDKLTNILPEVARGLKVEIADDLSMGELQNKVASLPPYSVILYTLFFRDNTGAFFDYDDSVTSIAEYAQAPIYGTWDFSLGFGIVGGKLASGYEQGNTAADIALQIIGGKPLPEIPVVMDSPNRYMFDYEQLERYGIELSKLPKDSLVINKPRTIMDDYAQAVYVAIGSFVVLSIVIALLITNILIRRRAESALTKSEKRFRELSDLLPQIIFEINREGRLLYTNRSGLEKTGYALEDIESGINILDMIAPEQHDVLKSNISKRYNQDVETANEYEVVRKDGTRFPALAYSSPIIVSEGKFAGLRGILVDVSDQKALQEHLARSQKMEAIGTLAGGIAHDFNNILSAILGYSELVELELPDDSPLRANVSQVIQAGNRAKQLVKQIFAFSKQSKNEMEPVQVSLVVKEVLKLLRASLPTTIELSQNITSTKLVMGDPSQLHQILMNLCTNAGKAMPDGGVMEVCLSDVQFDLEEAKNFQGLSPGSYLKLTVKDTGIGMTSDVKAKIFDPFFTTRQGGEGTGMGLSVVHGLVTNYHGHIGVKTSPGKGSIFTVFLPAMMGSEIKQTVEKDSLPTGKERILFVDDEPGLVQLGKAMLERLGYSVTAFSDSLEAADTFSAEPKAFDLVMTDMTMPNLRGDQLAARVLAINPDFPVIVCTGYSEKLSASKAEAMGIKGYIAKPYNITEIAVILRQVLDPV